MSRPVRPLLYMDNGSIPPGSLLSAASADGAVGRWTPAPRFSMIDPTKSYTMDQLVGAYNDLIWALHGARIVQSDPLLLFNSVGTGSVNFVRAKADGTEYTVTFTPGDGSLALSGIMPQLQSLFPGDDGINIIRQDNAITILLRNGSLRFEEAPSNTVPGTALRIMNILFAGAFDRGLSRSISLQTAFKMNETYEPNGTPIILQGNPHGGPYTKSPELASVSGFEVTATTSSSISLKWDKHPAADVTYYLELALKTGEAVRYETTDTSIIVSGLLPSNRYTITIMAGTSRSLSKKSEPITAETVNPIPNPFIIEAKSVTIDSVTVKWDVPTRDIFGIEVILDASYYNENGDLISLSDEIMSISNGSYTYSNLPKINWDYTISARVRNKIELSDPTSIVIKTAELAAPTISISNITDSSCVLAWSLPSDTVLVPKVGFDITMPDDSITTKEYAVSSGQTTLTELTPETNYPIKAYYISKLNSRGTATDEFTVTTLPEPGPVIREVKKYNLTVDVILMEAPPTTVSSVEFEITKVGRTEAPLIQSWLPSSTYTDTYSLTLDPVTTYSVRVRYEKNTGGYTKYSDPVTFTTLEYMFGPSKLGNVLTRGTDDVQLTLNNSYVGFRVDTTSLLIGYAFNRIVFPKLPSEGILTVQQLIIQGNDIRPGKFKISVFNKSIQTSDKQLIAESSLTDIQYSPTWGYSYIFTMFDPITTQEKFVTLSADMHIIFQSLDDVPITLREANISGYPLTGIRGVLSPSAVSISVTNMSYMCLFDFVSPYPFGSISNQVGWGTGERSISLNMTDPIAVGYRVPANSSWIGKSFNAIMFPKINGKGTVTNSSSSISVAINTIVNIGTNQLTQLTYISVNMIEDWENEYVISLGETITLQQNYTILFFITDSPQVSDSSLTFRTFEMSNPLSPPLEAISFINGKVEPATEGVICDFINT